MSNGSSAEITIRDSPQDSLIVPIAALTERGDGTVEVYANQRTCSVEILAISLGRVAISDLTCSLKAGDEVRVHTQ